MLAMASPQKEDGHTPIANEIMEALAGVSLNGTQFRLVMVILRKTYGWNKKMDTIGLLQFCEVTGLPKKLVSRELNRLARRLIITAWGDDHHPKQYGIQKDHSRWLEDDPPEVSTKQGTPAAKVSTENARSVPQTVDKVSTNWGTTKDSKARKTEPHGSGASAPPVFVGTMRERFEAEYKAAGSQRDRLTVVGRYFEQMLGPPNYPRLAKLLAEARSGGALFGFMAEAAKSTITDDPHSYLAKIIQRAQHDRGNGRMTQADHNSAKAGRLVT